MLDGIDCPPHPELTRMAEHPSDADPSISEHLANSSPCFREYMEILAWIKRAVPRRPILLVRKSDERQRERALTSSRNR